MAALLAQHGSLVLSKPYTHCCCNVGMYVLCVFFISPYLIAFSLGARRACVSILFFFLGGREERYIKLLLGAFGYLG